MDTIPTLALAPAHPVLTSSATTAASRVVDPTERAGCTWYVVGAAGESDHPHAA